MTAFLMIFRRFPTTFRRFPKIFLNCSEGQMKVREHFPKISENFRRCPKIAQDFPVMRCLQHQSMKISEDFPKLFRRPDESSRTFSENFRKFPKMSEDCPRLSSDEVSTTPVNESSKTPLEWASRCCKFSARTVTRKF